MLVCRTCRFELPASLAERAHEQLCPALDVVEAVLGPEQFRAEAETGRTGRQASQAICSAATPPTGNMPTSGGSTAAQRLQMPRTVAVAGKSFNCLAPARMARERLGGGGNSRHDPHAELRGRAR